MIAMLAYGRRSVNVHGRVVSRRSRGETGILRKRALAAGLDARTRAHKVPCQPSERPATGSGLGNAEFAEIPPKSRSPLCEHDWRPAVAVDVEPITCTNSVLELDHICTCSLHACTFSDNPHIDILIAIAAM